MWPLEFLAEFEDLSLHERLCIVTDDMQVTAWELRDVEGIEDAEVMVSIKPLCEYLVELRAELWIRLGDFHYDAQHAILDLLETGWMYMPDRDRWVLQGMTKRD